MLLFSLTSLTISMSLTLILANNPLTLGLWVLFIALCLSLNISFLFSSWFAFIVFLVYIGGMLVMFAYFTALMPNQPLEMSKMISFLLFTFSIVFYLIYSLSPMNSSFSLSHLSPLTTLLTPWNIPIFLFAAMILFFILVAVVKVANINQGPLRPFLYV